MTGNANELARTAALVKRLKFNFFISMFSG